MTAAISENGFDFDSANDIIWASYDRYEEVSSLASLAIKGGKTEKQGRKTYRDYRESDEFRRFSEFEIENDFDRALSKLLRGESFERQLRWGELGEKLISIWERDNDDQAYKNFKKLAWAVKQHRKIKKQIHRRSGFDPVDLWLKDNWAYYLPLIWLEDESHLYQSKIKSLDRAKKFSYSVRTEIARSGSEMLNDYGWDQKQYEKALRFLTCLKIKQRRQQGNRRDLIQNAVQNFESFVLKNDFWHKKMPSFPPLCFLSFEAIIDLIEELNLASYTVFERRRIEERCKVMGLPRFNPGKDGIRYSKEDFRKGRFIWVLLEKEGQAKKRRERLNFKRLS